FLARQGDDARHPPGALQPRWGYAPPGSGVAAGHGRPRPTDRYAHLRDLQARRGRSLGRAARPHRRGSRHRTRPSCRPRPGDPDGSGERAGYLTFQSRLLPQTRGGAVSAVDMNELLARRLHAETEGEVLFDAASRGRYATDASIYQIMPVGVLVPKG